MPRSLVSGSSARFKVKTRSRAQTSELPAVLFDLDGTLIDSVYQHVQAWHETLRDAGIRIPIWKIHRRVGMSGKFFLRELLREIAPKRRGMRLTPLENGHDKRFARMIPALEALPGVNELLQHLHRSGVRIAIATTSNRKQTLLLLRKLRVPSGTPILTGDDVENAKPSPDIFVAAAQSLKIPIHDCIVVGDIFGTCLQPDARALWASACCRAVTPQMS
jgi:beta-phosphoglucomutase-like phosphatase (HAD superfamily)